MGSARANLRGLPWGSYNGEQLSVERSASNGTVSERKTKRSLSPIPVVRPLAEPLKAHRLRAGKSAQSNLPSSRLEMASQLSMRGASLCQRSRFARPVTSKSPNTYPPMVTPSL
jgi:hypothetical protein